MSHILFIVKHITVYIEFYCSVSDSFLANRELAS